jgi:predicted RNase H-like nuclease
MSSSQVGKVKDDLDVERPVAGVDGFRGGWVVALLAADGSAEVRTTASFFDVTVLDVDVIAVDVPLGVLDAGFRPADSAARGFLGGERASSVFSTPPRASLEADTFAQAVLRAREAAGKGISQQAFALRKRILEVDAIAAVDERVIEVHPEVSFRELAGRPLRHSKHTPEGLDERRALLRGAGLESARVAGVPEADLLDALVAAWTGARHRRGESRPLPADHTDRIGAVWR